MHLGKVRCCRQELVKEIQGFLVAMVLDLELGKIVVGDQGLTG